MCWLRSITRITYFSKLIGILSLAAFLNLEIYWVLIFILHLRAHKQINKRDSPPL
ncbi:hypothetical protein FORC066_1156 [Yersinia enterocolitica]|nr:hypothetical protein FORC066_1156 [Yersinia enterocolitica]